MKMEKIIRLYSQHDLDLIGLCRNPSYPFSYYMKRAIVAWAREDKSFSIPLPSSPPTSEILLKSCSIHIKFSKDEVDVFEKLKTIEDRYGNSCLKTIFRGYLEQPYITPYISDSMFIYPNKANKKQTSYLENENIQKNESFEEESAQTEKKQDVTIQMEESKTEIREEIKEEVKSETEVKKDDLVDQILSAIDKYKSIGISNPSISDIAKILNCSEDKVELTMLKNNITLEQEESSKSEETITVNEEESVNNDDSSNNESLEDFDLFGKIGAMM